MSCDDTNPFISFDLTISCLASLLFVPGFVRLIFILRPLSTVAECSTAILPGLPGFPCAAFTPLTAALLCLLLPVPVTIAAEPFVFPVPLLPALPPMLPFPLPGLFDRPQGGPDEPTDSEDEADDDDEEDDDEDVDEDDDDEDDDEEEDVDEFEDEDEFDD